MALIGFPSANRNIAFEILKQSIYISYETFVVTVKMLRQFSSMAVVRC